MRTFPYRLLPLWALVCALLLGNSALGQIQVSLRFPRNSYLLNEPTTANLTITNLAGRDLYFEDSPTYGPWCRIELKNLRGDFVSPHNDRVAVPPLSVPSGETVTRSIRLTDFFRMPEPGDYQLRVQVLFEPTGNQFNARAGFTADLGKLEWSQTVGVPEGRAHGGDFRTFSLLSHRTNEGIFLYATLESKGEGLSFPPYPLGRMLLAMRPQTALDPRNNLYVLHALSDSEYALSQVDVDTGRFGQARYRSATPRGGRPSLARNGEGKVAILGGVRITDSEMNAQNSGRVLLSDRPNIVPAPAPRDR